MESKIDIIAFDLDASAEHNEGIVLTQEQRDALAERIGRVILDRRRVGITRRMQARLRQLQSLERARERQQTPGENCCEAQVKAE
jgi:hypothetical protein